jgi:hypothetical protein
VAESVRATLHFGRQHYANSKSALQGSLKILLFVRNITVGGHSDETVRSRNFIGVGSNSVEVSSVAAGHECPVNPLQLCTFNFHLLSLPWVGLVEVTRPELGQTDASFIYISVWVPISLFCRFCFSHKHQIQKFGLTEPYSRRDNLTFQPIFLFSF